MVKRRKIYIVLYLLALTLFLAYYTIWYIPNNGQNILGNGVLNTPEKPMENKYSMSHDQSQQLLNQNIEKKLFKHLKNITLAINKLDKLINTKHNTNYIKFQTELQPSFLPSVQKGSGYRNLVLIAGHNLESGYLNHVYEVFKYYGYETTSDKNSNWDVLWHHDYPFVDKSMNLTRLKCQKVNHFPGSGYITNKVTLMEFKDGEERPPYLPIAFSLPSQAALFSEYVKLRGNNSSSSWVLKGNDHRGIEILTATQIHDIASTNGSSASDDVRFVQSYVPDPLLIDGRKFDIGIYVAITSIYPLRAYSFGSDVLFRFCSVPYRPFHPSIRNKYVVADDYTPLWEMPSLAKYYVNHDSTFKSAFDSHLRDTDLNVEHVWDQIEYIIRDTLIRKRKDIYRAQLAATPSYPDILGTVTSPYFEMVRFDFILDDNLTAYLMEVNMSPNLSSDHFPPNSRLYLRLLNDLLNLLGLGSGSSSANRAECRRSRQHRTYVQNRNMDVSIRDLSVFVRACSTYCNSSSACDSPLRTDGDTYYTVCHVCSRCFTGNRDLVETFADSFHEHRRKHGFERLLPAAPSTNRFPSRFGSRNLPPLPLLGNEPSSVSVNLSNFDAEVRRRASILKLFVADLKYQGMKLSYKNRFKFGLDGLLELWYEGKCLDSNSHWCFK